MPHRHEPSWRVERPRVPAGRDGCDWDLVAGTVRPRRPARPPRGRPGRPAAILRLLVAGPLALAAVAALSLHARDGEPATAAAPPPPPLWAAADPATAPVRHEAEGRERIPLTSSRVSTVLGLREDTFALGRFAAPEAAFLRLVATTALPGAAPKPGEAEASPTVVLVRRAAQADGLAVGRITGRDVIESRLGTLDTLDVVLAGAASRACTSLRLRQAPDSVLALDGYVCGPQGSLPETASLGCLVDRITLAEVPGALASPGRGRSGCGSVETTASTAPAAVGERPDRAPRRGARLGR